MQRKDLVIGTEYAVKRSGYGSALPTMITEFVAGTGFPPTPVAQLNLIYQTFATLKPATLTGFAGKGEATMNRAGSACTVATRDIICEYAQLEASRAAMVASLRVAAKKDPAQQPLADRGTLIHEFSAALETAGMSFYLMMSSYHGPTAGKFGVVATGTPVAKFIARVARERDDAQWAWAAQLMELHITPETAAIISALTDLGIERFNLRSSRSRAEFLISDPERDLVEQLIEVSA